MDEPSQAEQRACRPTASVLRAHRVMQIYRERGYPACDIWIDPLVDDGPDIVVAWDCGPDILVWKLVRQGVAADPQNAILAVTGGGTIFEGRTVRCGPSLGTPQTGWNVVVQYCVTVETILPGLESYRLHRPESLIAEDLADEASQAAGVARRLAGRTQREAENARVDAGLSRGFTEPRYWNPTGATSYTGRDGRR